MKRFLPCSRRQGLSWVFLAWATTAQAQAAPPEAVQAFTEVTAAYLGLRFDAEQRQQIAQHIQTYWQRQQRAPMDAVRATVRIWADMQASEPAQRAVALRISRATILRNLTQEATRGDDLAIWLLAQYHQVHPRLAPAAPGGVALTRDSVDGQLDLAHFMATEIHRQPARLPTPSEREQAYRAAAARHAGLSADEQLAVAQAPGEAARLRWGWQRAGAMDRLLGRADLGGRLTPAEQAQLQQFLASLNAQLQGLQAQQHAMLQGSLAHIRQNSELIMGRGTVWNPATNRWEQQGGIVTEYDGRVRGN